MLNSLKSQVNTITFNICFNILTKIRLIILSGYEFLYLINTKVTY